MLAALAARGHDVAPRPDGDMLFGAAAVAGVADGGGGAVLCAADPRREDVGRGALRI